jgi:hypothetical protein
MFRNGKIAQLDILYQVEFKAAGQYLSLPAQRNDQHKKK